MEPLLEIQNVTVDFNGFKALNDLNITIGRGELRFIIGPNGAGKTTLIDVISGKVRPAAGRVVFNGGVELTQLQEHTIVKRGVGRKFQTPALFPDLSVHAHLELASGLRSRWTTLLCRTRPETEDRIELTLKRLRLERLASTKAGVLSHGQKQWLEIGMLLVQEPRLMLLDEPVAGMTNRERTETGELLQELAGDCSVVVVEHDMDFVRRYSNRVTVLHGGRLLSEGSMLEIQRDQQVIDSYLGRSNAPRKRPARPTNPKVPISQWHRTEG